MYMPHTAGGLGINSFEEGLVGGVLLSDAPSAPSSADACPTATDGGTTSSCSPSSSSSARWHAPSPPDLWALYPARFVLGFAVGGASATVPVYLAETAPKRIRGTLVGVDQLMIVTGQFLAFVMNAIIARGITGGPEARV